MHLRLLTFASARLLLTIMTKAELYEFLASHRLAVLGSISEEGTPQSALVGIAVTEDLEIVFDTLNSTRKYRNLISNPKASLVVGWDWEKTVQFEGEAALPVGEELMRYKNVYFSAWPDGVDREHWPGLVHFVVRPQWIRFSDFSVGAPRIEEMVFNR
jgi:pyridoxine/pyridoxamine 5'-phosphate oxidase